jgi:hypothetical protein
MAPCDAIQAQLEVLRQNLIRCRLAVDNPGIDAKLRGRVAARFDKELTRLEAEHKTLKKKVTSGHPLDACWHDLGEAQRDSGKVFDECLAFIQGALARKAGLDEQMCGLTDDLLDDLAAYSDVPWGRFTLLATSEFYLDRAEIIRIRYPEVSLWSMPLAAHEFGHYLGPQLRQGQGGEYIYPFQTLLRTADETRSNSLHTPNWHHLQEHFADLFAAYTLGPAYAAAFIVLRMNPSQAQDDARTHPSGARRVHGILWTLDKMDELQATPLRRPFRDVTKLLSEVWHNGLQQAEKPEKLSDADASLVNQRMAELFDLLTSATPQRLGFGRDDWLRAEGVAARIAGDLAFATLPDQLSRRDVLNGAWLARLQATDKSPYALNDIAVRALAEYRSRSRPAS